MSLLAKDIMVTHFDTISEDATVQEAIRLMKFAPNSPKDRRIFGLMVVNEENELTGMIAMHDILFHVRPAYMKHGQYNAGLLWSGQFDAACMKLKNMQVKEIMSKSMVTITEDTGIARIMDIIIKNHIRRIPVLRGKNIVGIVYVSDVFNESLTRLSPIDQC